MPSSDRTLSVERAAPLLVMFAAAAAFSPVFGNGWAHWDDDLFILGNPHIRSFSLDNLRWMATTFLSGTYQPLAWLSYAVDYRLWGLDPRGFHLASLLLHSFTALLVYELILGLLRRASPGASSGSNGALAAAFGALFFALHPLRVEAVAWASERRQAIAVALVLAALLAYLEAADSKGKARRAWLAVSLLLFGLSSAAKAVAIGLPIALLALDAYPLRRKAWLEKLPFFAVSAFGAAVGYAAQAQGQSVWSLDYYGPPSRLAQAGYNLAFYARKTILPCDLSPLYAVPLNFSPWEPRFILSWAFVVGATVFAWRFRRRFPAVWTAWVSYVALLAPVLGLVQSGRQFAADRYSDLPCVGASALAAALLLAALAGRKLRPGALCAAGAVLIGLTAASLRQIAVWSDPISLWTRAAEVEPWSAIARDNLGVAYARAGRPAEAAKQFEAVLAVDPYCAEARARADDACRDARLNLISTRADLGDLDGAIEGLRRLLSEEPENEMARLNLARALELKSAGGRPR